MQMMDNSENARDFLRLTLAQNIGAKTFSAILDYFGDLPTALATPLSKWKKIKGLGPKKIEALASVTDSVVDEELELANSQGAAVITSSDERYPPALKNIHDAPPVLYVKGKLEPEDALALGIVGSRSCTHYGAEQAQRFGALLGRAGFTVISGGARGIDTSAHYGALRSGGRTIAVMGCGLIYDYPPENAELYKEILEYGKGCLISELPMRTAVMSGNFPTRNRIISGMSLGILLVEASVPSGALITVTDAIEHGKEVFAIPGRVDSPMSNGTNKIIREQSAHLVTDLDDILGPLDEVGRKMKAVEEETPIPERPQGMDKLESEIYDVLELQAMSLDEIVRKTEKPVGEIASAMTMLVIKRIIEQQPGNVFSRKR